MAVALWVASIALFAFAAAIVFAAILLADVVDDLTCVMSLLESSTRPRK